jgi:hypothetical protein
LAVWVACEYEIRDAGFSQASIWALNVNHASKRTPETIALALRLRAEGKTFSQIGTTIGVSKTTIFFWVDANPAGRRNKYLYGEEVGAPTLGGLVTSDAMSSEAKETGEVLLRQIPKDTRTTAQKLMGEPIFERSALAQRHRVI